MRQTSTKSAINMIMIHRAQTKAIFGSDLSDEHKIMIIKQLNLSCEMLLQRENCYFGYVMPDLTEGQRVAVQMGLFSKVGDSVEWVMHHYQVRSKVPVLAEAVK